jgi:hypothetical protein
MGEPMGLDGVKSLEEKRGLDQARAGRIAIEDRDDIGAKRLADRRITADKVEIGLADKLAGKFRVAETCGEAMDDRGLECYLIENRGKGDARHIGLVARHLFGFDPKPFEDRVTRRDACDLDCTLDEIHETSPECFRPLRPRVSARRIA